MGSNAFYYIPASMAAPVIQFPAVKAPADYNRSKDTASSSVDRYAGSYLPRSPPLDFLTKQAFSLPLPSYMPAAAAAQVVTASSSNTMEPTPANSPAPSPYVAMNSNALLQAGSIASYRRSSVDSAYMTQPPSHAQRPQPHPAVSAARPLARAAAAASETRRPRSNSEPARYLNGTRGSSPEDDETKLPPIGEGDGNGVDGVARSKPVAISGPMASLGARGRRGSKSTRIGTSPSSVGKDTVIYQCEECGKVYKHPNCLIKHRWEHTPQWKEASKFSLSKHQQVQLLEAAQILLEMENSGRASADGVDSDDSTQGAHPSARRGSLQGQMGMMSLADDMEI